jgi:hypothetical protein
MIDHADKPSEQSPIARLSERQAVQFISDALRAGQRAILVTGRGQVSMRVPEEALAACAGTSTRTLHIGPPLPEPPELHEMIGAAVEIAGAREMTPQGMARLLLFADPRPTVILAIDDAHTLSYRSLSYLTQMTELLASDAPVLQIVLAAQPALLDTLAQPEFERFRNRLCRPGFESFQTLNEGGANGAFSGLRKSAHGRAPAALAHLHYAYPTAASPRGHGRARPAAYAAAGVVAIGCLNAIGYIAFSALTVGPTLPPIPSLNSAAEQLGAAGNGDRAALSPNAAAPAPPSAAPDQNVDAAPPAMPANAAPTAPDDPTAPSAEQLGAAGNGDRAALSPNAAAPAPPSAAPDQNVAAAPPAIPAKAAPTAPDRPTSQVVADLPTLAPVRVILNMARNDSGRARRSGDIRRALAAAGLEVSDLVHADAQRPGPSIGYYFQSDRNAAAEVSHLLAPLLGVVDPVVFRKRGTIPEPGTIEVAIP